MGSALIFEMIVVHPHVYIWEVWDWRQQNCLKQQSTFMGRQWDGSGGWRLDGRWITFPQPWRSVVWEDKRPDMEVWGTSPLRGRESHGKRCRPRMPTRSSCRGRRWRKETRRGTTQRFKEEMGNKWMMKRGQGRAAGSGVGHRWPWRVTVCACVPVLRAVRPRSG